ncbi:MAG: hypothetical protein V1911_00165 [Candidatus Micrarchaeota archaeon]
MGILDRIFKKENKEEEKVAQREEEIKEGAQENKEEKAGKKEERKEKESPLQPKEKEKADEIDPKYMKNLCTACEQPGADKRFGGTFWHRQCLRKARKMAKSMI